MAEKDNYIQSIDRLEVLSVSKEERLHQFEDGMGEIESITEKEAIQIFLKHHNLMLAFNVAERRLLDNLIVNNSNLYASTNQEIAEIKLRLKRASQGDYSPAIRYYKYTGKSMMNGAEGDPLFIIQGTAFLRLAEALPKNSPSDITKK